MQGIAKLIAGFRRFQKNFDPRVSQQKTGLTKEEQQSIYQNYLNLYLQLSGQECKLRGLAA